jgi:cob(I)alamin adenosyltransferase
MHIYTRSGDNGETSLIGGKRVPKYHIRIEAYGTVDELISYIGLIRDQNISSEIKDQLIEVQSNLMTCASILAADCEDCDVELPELKNEHVAKLEQDINKMELELPPLNSFVLPGGHTAVSFTHITRNICRRAERYAIRLNEETEISEEVIQYLNRLSDYLFMLGRKFVNDFGVKEILWKPNSK